MKKINFLLQETTTLLIYYKYKKHTSDEPPIKCLKPEKSPYLVWQNLLNMCPCAYTNSVFRSVT